MFFRLLALLIITPLVELAILYQVAQLTSIWWTIGLVAVTGFVGTTLAHQQGLRTWRAIGRGLAAGRMPSDEMLDGVLILVAGAVLLTPGLLTDIFGLSLLIPYCRKFYRRWLVRRFRARFRLDRFSSGAGFDRYGQSEILDSYVVESDKPHEPNQPREIHEPREPPRS